MPKNLHLLYDLLLFICSQQLLFIHSSIYRNFLLFTWHTVSPFLRERILKPFLRSPFLRSPFLRERILKPFLWSPSKSRWQERTVKSRGSRRRRDPSIKSLLSSLAVPWSPWQNHRLKSPWFKRNGRCDHRDRKITVSLISTVEIPLTSYQGSLWVTS